MQQETSEKNREPLLEEGAMGPPKEVPKPEPSAAYVLLLVCMRAAGAPAWSYGPANAVALAPKEEPPEFAP